MYEDRIISFFMYYMLNAIAYDYDIWYILETETRYTIQH